MHHDGRRTHVPLVFDTESSAPHLDVFTPCRLQLGGVPRSPRKRTSFELHGDTKSRLSRSTTHRAPQAMHTVAGEPTPPTILPRTAFLSNTPPTMSRREPARSLDIKASRAGAACPQTSQNKTINAHIGPTIFVPNTHKTCFRFDLSKNAKEESWSKVEFIELGSSSVDAVMGRLSTLIQGSNTSQVETGHAATVVRICMDAFGTPDWFTQGGSPSLPFPSPYALFRLS